MFLFIGRRRKKGRKGRTGDQDSTNNGAFENISLPPTNDGPASVVEAADNDAEVPNEVSDVVSVPPTKKPTGNRRRGQMHGSREGSVEQTGNERGTGGALSSTSTTTTTTTTTTSTEAPKRQTKGPLHNPIEIKYTVDGGRETPRTIVDFFPDLPPVADEEREVEDVETHLEVDQQTPLEETQQEAPGDPGTRNRRKKKKKTKKLTVVEEEPPTDYLDEEVDPQDYQSFLYGLENPEDSSTETEGVEDLFPDGLPEGYPTDRFRADGNYSQNTR